MIEVPHRLTGALLLTRDGSDLAGADLQGEDLLFGNLRGIGMRGARLSHASLGQCDLTECDLHAAWLEGADFKDALLSKAVFAHCMDLHRAVGLERAIVRDVVSIDIPILPAAGDGLPAALLEAAGLSAGVAALRTVSAR